LERRSSAPRGTLRAGHAREAGCPLLNIRQPWSMRQEKARDFHAHLLVCAAVIPDSYPLLPIADKPNPLAYYVSLPGSAGLKEEEACLQPHSFLYKKWVVGDRFRLFVATRAGLRNAASVGGKELTLASARARSFARQRFAFDPARCAWPRMRASFAGPHVENEGGAP